MSSDYPFMAKIVSPVKCNEKPWDLWVSEIGHSSPKQDDFGSVFSTSAGADAKTASMRRPHESHPYKQERNHVRYKRTGFTRLKYETAKLHGLFPQMDNLNVAVCHMCGVVVKCSAVYKHLLESHSVLEPILPPPPPAPSIKIKSSHSKSRHKKENTLGDVASIKVQKPLANANNPPLSRLVLPEMQYLDDATGSMPGEVQVCVESGELPVVSIQDTDELPLGENITDDIFAIMNSEGIQSADNITNVADWKNIIRDIGSMQDINFNQPTDSVQTQEIYPQVDSSYSAPEVDLSRVQLPPNTSAAVQRTDTNPQITQSSKPVASSAVSSTTKHHSRSKSSKSKSSIREYDPNKHCGVVTLENPKPCTRSLTCKAHALSLRRMVEGRSKKFDVLLAEHRASKDAASGNPPMAVPIANLATPVPPTIANAIDINNFNSLTEEQQVNDIYASLLSVEDPDALPDTTTLTSLLSQPLNPDSFLLPDDAEIPSEIPIISIASPEPVSSRLEEKMEEEPPPLIPSDVCWYSSCPRPLAVCTFNSSHAGGTITLGKKFATVRSNIKSSLTRSQCKSNTSMNNFYYNPNPLSLSKSLHVNSSKSNKLEVRRLIVTSSSNVDHRDVQETFSDLFGNDVRHTVNGHLQERRPRSNSLKQSKGQSHNVLDLGFSLDPILADEKC